MMRARYHQHHHTGVAMHEKDYRTLPSCAAAANFVTVSAVFVGTTIIGSFRTSPAW